MKELISIIVPVYNVEKYLYKCIDSILNQTYKNLEVILIDDGSPDNCPYICDEYAVKDSRIKVIHKKNEGVSAARNDGIDMAKGGFISFVDADDWIEPGMIEYLLNIALENNVKFSSCGYSCDNEDGEVLRTSVNGKRQVMDLETALIHQYEDGSLFGSPWAILFPSWLFNKEKGIRFDESISIGEDKLFVCECIIKAGSLVFDTKQLYHYFQRPDSAWNSVFNKKKLTMLDALSKQIAITEPVNNKAAILCKCLYTDYAADLLASIYKEKASFAVNKLYLSMLKKAAKYYFYEYLYSKNVLFYKKIKLLLLLFLPMLNNLMYHKK